MATLDLAKQALDEATVTRLVTCPFFNIEKVRFSEGVESPVPYDQPVIWMFLDGQMYTLTGIAKKRSRFLLPSGCTTICWVLSKWEPGGGNRPRKAWKWRKN